MGLWIVFAIVLPLITIIGSILVINVYFRKQIAKDITPKSSIDQAYITAEETMPDDQDLGSILERPRKQIIEERK